MVTIKKIADLCGVSRGTVDRVINDRGNVKPETKELVLNMARQLGYKPNPAGKALSARKKHPVVGVLISSEGNPFLMRSYAELSWRRKNTKYTDWK